jgi:YHS domain-containing protein
MNNLKAGILTAMLILAVSGIAAAQHEHGAGMSSDQTMGGMMMGGHAAKHEGMDNCVGHIAGAAYAVQNTKEGAVITITASDPAVVKKIQDSAKKLTETKAAASNPDEMVVCPVYGTKIKKSQAFDSAVYKGKTYYFCCAACKPLFLKNPEKYVK